MTTEQEDLFFIEKQLDKCKFISNCNRTKKLAIKNGNQRGLGYTNPVGLKLNYCNGNGDQVYLNVCKLISKYYPNHKFNALTINKNFRCKKHIDNKNTGVSWVVGLGDYIGGELNIYSDKDIKVDIKYKPKIFDGSTLEHDVDIWRGTRYSIVAYYL